MANLFSLIFSFSFVVWSFENSEDTISFSLLHPDRHPVILSIKTKSLNPTTGEIEFETDDETKSEIEFGLAEDYGSRIEGTWNLKHRFIIPALKEGIYHFKVKAKDRDGNEVESLDQSFEIEGLIPPLFKDLFEDERELRSSVFEPESQTAKWQNGWLSKEGTWWSKWGKMFPYFKEEVSKEELEKPMSELKKDSSEHVLPFSQVLPFLPDFEWKNYLVEFKVRPDYNQAKFGIGVRYNPEDGSGYYLWIEQIKQKKPKLPLNYTITLEKKVRGKSELLSDTIYTNSLRWFIIEVMVDRERIEVSVDGKKVIKVKDSEIQKGQIALITEQRLPLTVIDDFLVRPITKKGLLSKKQNGREIQAKAQSEITLNPSSNFIPSTPAENSYTYKEQGKGPNTDSELFSPFSPISHFSPEPIYQTTSSLPPSELVYTNTLRWFIIEVMVDGERIEVSVDGKKVIRVRDSEIQKGKIALITEQRLPLTVIDDFVVRPIGKKGIFSKTDRKNSKLITQNLQSPSLPILINSQSEISNLKSQQGKGPNESNFYEISESLFFSNGQQNEEEEELITTIGEHDWRDYTVEKSFPAYREREGYKKDPSSGEIVPISETTVIYGLGIRFSETNGSGYYLWIEGEVDRYKGEKVYPCKISFEKRVGGKKEIITEREYIAKGEWIWVEVGIEGERIRVKINNEELFEVLDEDIKQGKVALFRKPALDTGLPWEFRKDGLKIRRLISEKEKVGISKDKGLVDRTSKLLFIKDKNSSGPNTGSEYEILELSNFGVYPDPIYQTTTTLPPNERVRYYHHDHLGNIRVVTDGDRNINQVPPQDLVVERHDFYPFGEEITTQPQSKDQYLFTGKPRDSETGLDYFGARYYSSSLARFLSPDIASPDYRNPQTLNRYTYCRNNPLRYIDPDGEYEWEFHFWITAITAFAAGYDIGEAWSIASANIYTDFNSATTSVTFEGALAEIGIGDNPQARMWHFCTNDRLRDLENITTQNKNYTLIGRFTHAYQDSIGAHAPFIKKASHFGETLKGNNVDDPSTDVSKAMGVVQGTFEKLWKFKTGKEPTNREKATFEKYKPDIEKALSIKNRRERYLALKKIWDKITEERRKEWEATKQDIKSGGREGYVQK